MTDTITGILDFWFGELDEDGRCANERHALWFSANQETDATCRRRFGRWLDLALVGKLDAWAQTDRGLIALVILLDQFSRNIHRGTARAFAGDEQALALAQQALAVGRHRQLPAIHRAFLYMPLEHCENLDIQETCVALFEALSAQTGEPLFANFARYARAHRDVIRQFGRFPHRNALLGRPSSAAELAHLEHHGGF